MRTHSLRCDPCAQHCVSPHSSAPVKSSASEKVFTTVSIVAHRRDEVRRNLRAARRTQASSDSCENTLRLAAASWSHLAAPPEGTHPPLFAPVSSPVQAAPPQSHDQVYPSAASANSISWEAPIDDVLVDVLLKNRACDATVIFLESATRATVCSTVYVLVGVPVVESDTFPRFSHQQCHCPPLRRRLKHLRGFCFDL